jgi:hypothetical protein
MSVVIKINLIFINFVIDKLNRIQNLKIYKSVTSTGILYCLQLNFFFLIFSNMTFEKLNHFLSSGIREENFLLSRAHTRELSLMMLDVNRIYHCIWYLVIVMGPSE